jgi:hypothetical protein
MTTPAQFVRSVTRRALALMIEADGRLDYAQAERIASRDVAKQERAKPKPITSRPSPTKAGGAKARLAQMLTAISQRMTAGVANAGAPDGVSGERRAVPDVRTSPLARAARDLLATNKFTEPEPPSDTVLIYASNSPTGATLIEDEFKDYPRYHDRNLATWRESIRANERRLRELGRG